MDAYLIHRVMIKKSFGEEAFFTSMHCRAGQGKGKFDEEMQKKYDKQGTCEWSLTSENCFHSSSNLSFNDVIRSSSD